MKRDMLPSPHLTDEYNSRSIELESSRTKSSFLSTRRESTPEKVEVVCSDTDQSWEREVWERVKQGRRFFEIKFRSFYSVPGYSGRRSSSVCISPSTCVQDELNDSVQDELNDYSRV
jgi:hypothetical protein